MNRRIVLLMVLTPMLGHAHHNSTAIYDQQATPITIEGTVTEIRFVQPHARVYLDVSSDDGGVDRWTAEGNSPAVLRRRGWTGNEMKPGDHIRITGAPSRDGSLRIEWHTILLSDGTELRGGNLSVPEREDLLDRLERERANSRR